MDTGTNGSAGLEAGGAGPLRALTYLAPGLPLELFQRVTEHLASALGRGIVLESEQRSSGPMHGDSDPFAEGRADLGFLCSPSYLYLRAQTPPSVDLVPAGFVFADRRSAGLPVYYSDVVVRTEAPARSLEDLAGGVWGYNDDCSLSGYFSVLQRLAAHGHDGGFFARRVRTGSHHASIRALLEGSVDVAAIDSTALARALRERPELEARLRLLESLGPFPIQPVVARRALGREFVDRVGAALLELHASPERAARLAEFGLEGCVPIDDSAYAEERRALQALQQLPRALEDEP